MGKRQMEATAICFWCNFPWLQDRGRSRSTSAAPETSEGEPTPAAEALASVALSFFLTTVRSQLFEGTSCRCSCNWSVRHLVQGGK